MTYTPDELKKALPDLLGDNSNTEAEIVGRYLTLLTAQQYVVLDWEHEDADVSMAEAEAWFATAPRRELVAWQEEDYTMGYGSVELAAMDEGTCLLISIAGSGLASSQTLYVIPAQAEARFVGPVTA